MDTTQITGAHIDRYFDRVLDRHLDAPSGEPVYRYQECKNGALRDCDENRFVTASEYDEYEHSQHCTCPECTHHDQEEYHD